MLYFSFLLLHRAISGGLCTLFLFFLCFAIVHLVLYAKIGWQTRETASKNESPPQDTPPQKEEKPAPSSEPIYYIVERKKTRVKHRYSEPKEIRFKEK